MKRIKRNLALSICLLISFVIWTIAVNFVDVQPIGPNGSSVGFSTINEFFHNLTGVNFDLYIITDWLGLVPVFICMAFAIVGLIQLISRKSLFKVDFNILTLGVFYIVTIAVYLFFEYFVVNYRPVLINGYLEASYPSSTTMLVMCVMPTALMQFNNRIKNKIFNKSVNIIIVGFIIFMVIGRLISGVHWISDIIGGALFSAGLVMMYYFVNLCKRT